MKLLQVVRVHDKFADSEFYSTNSFIRMAPHGSSSSLIVILDWNLLKILHLVLLHPLHCASRVVNAHFIFLDFVFTSWNAGGWMGRLKS